MKTENSFLTNTIDEITLRWLAGSWQNGKLLFLLFNKGLSILRVSEKIKKSNYTSEKPTKLFLIFEIRHDIRKSLKTVQQFLDTINAA